MLDAGLHTLTYEVVEIRDVLEQVAYVGFALSLRMNLYGWRLSALLHVLGSKDTSVLEGTTALLAKTLTKEPVLSKAKAWLRTLIESGFPLAKDREPPSVPADGDLLTVQMETEAHVFVMHCLARTIASHDHLDLASESSHWAHAGVGSLYQELASCGFTRSKNCCVEFFSWMSRLSEGSPLFGDDFRSEWSFYTLFTNEELAAMLPVFQAAADFRRPIPEGYSEEARNNIKTTLSDISKEFISDLIKLFGQIHQAGQDAFILWW